MLENISKYGWKPNYVEEREKIVKGMTVEQIKALAQKYLNADKMIWLVIGDAKTQLPRLKDLGFGEPVLLNVKSQGEF
jgi:zinc protease